MCKWRFGLALLLAALALPGCKARYQSDAIAPPAASAPYLLDSGDKLRIVVYDQANLSASYTVDGGGNISFPLIGTVRARGISTQALAQTLAARLRAGFLRNPNVTVEIEAYRPFFILGEVRNPGQYPYVNGMTVQTAVAIAGGFSARARKDEVQVTRPVKDRVWVGRLKPTQQLRPGDTVNVEERFF